METSFDQKRADHFADTMLNMLNDGALALMTSIGHRTGLFDTLASLPPSTSAAIARAAGLNERYVREWLGAMVTGRIVDYAPATETYLLPAEHAACLTRAAAPNNLAMFMQYIPLLGAIEDGIVRSFRNGGGVPYAAYPRFQQVMAEESSQTVAAALVDAILPLVPGIIEALGEGIEVLDVGCGRGHTLNVMAQAFPNSRFTGYDFSPEGIAAGQAEAQERGLTNTMAEVDHYRLVTAFDAIHDQAKPREVLRQIAIALHPHGTFLMQDITASSSSAGHDPPYELKTSLSKMLSYPSWRLATLMGTAPPISSAPMAASGTLPTVVQAAGRSCGGRVRRSGSWGLGILMGTALRMCSGRRGASGESPTVGRAPGRRSTCQRFV